MNEDINDNKPFVSEAVHSVQISSAFSVENSNNIAKSTMKTPTKQKKPVSYSSMVFKAMRSYIPNSNYKWLNS